MNQVVLKAGKEKRLKAGHLWIYQGEIGIIGIGVKSGDVVEVLDNRGRFLGLGYYNQASTIAVRILTMQREPIDRDFFRKRLKNALAYREKIKPEASCYRLVYGEGDLLPGLIVDRFEDYLVVQFLTMGMEVNRDLIIEILVELCRPKGIIERSDTSTRHLEELPERSGCIYGTCPESIIINDNKLKFHVNLLERQKACYFLDQSANRAVLAKYARGRRSLDCFCHSGSFAVHAAAYGATSVLAVDISEDAICQAETNAVLNGVGDRCRFKVANVFDFLRDQVGKKEVYDLIILDPPAFTKSKQALEGALRSYKEINFRGLKLLRPGGILVTCSSSPHLSAELFWEIITTAAADNKQRLRLLERRGQGLDHPVLVGVPETEYLKCFILEVIG